MIQRIQTVYLLLAFLCAVMVIFFPFFSIDVVTESTKYPQAEFGAYGFRSSLEGEGLGGRSVPLYLVFIVLSLLTLTAIFLYKNRKAQLVVARLSLVFHLLIAVAVYAFYYIGRDYLADNILLPEGETADVKLGMMPGFYFLVSTIPLLVLAVRGIKRDENLVKSLDRLR